MTYLSQFPRAKTQPKGRISGVEKKPVVGIRTHFFVDTEKDTIAPDVTVRDHEGQLIPTAVEKVDAFPNRYQASFVPERPGKHEVYAIQNIQRMTDVPFRFLCRQSIQNQTLASRSAQ